MGGLGNQLFQVATMIGYALEHGLDYFIIEDDPAFFAGQGSRPTKYLTNVYAKLPKQSVQTLASKRMLTYKEPANKFAYSDFGAMVSSCKKNGVGLQIHGYFQSGRYFDKHRAAIKALLTPVAGLIEEVRTTTDLFVRFPELDPTRADSNKRCFLGVRRGDYCRDARMMSIHNPCSMDYYKQAMDRMNADVYYVMSDDIAWCRANFQGPQFRFLDEPDDLVSFYFARLFSNYICANSSFHWWGSYLSVDPAPTVIVPAEHFGPAGPQDYQDYFRPEMIRISNLVGTR